MKGKTPSLHVIRCLIKIEFETFFKVRCLIETGVRHWSNLGLILAICQAHSHLAMEMDMRSGFGQAPKGFFSHTLPMGGTREFVRHLFN